MNIYTPSDYRSIRHDLDYLLAQVGELYDVDIQPGGIQCTSLTRLPDGVSWASATSTEHFNALVPRVKLIHMGMYALLEAVAKHEMKLRSMIMAYEQWDPLFPAFRKLNNQFKHFEQRGAAIQLVQFVILEGKRGGRLELVYRVDSRNIPYGSFIAMFLILLKKAEVISY